MKYIMNEIIFMGIGLFYYLVNHFILGNNILNNSIPLQGSSYSERDFSIKLFMKYCE